MHINNLNLELAFSSNNNVNIVYLKSICLFKENLYISNILSYSMNPARVFQYMYIMVAPIPF